MKRLLAAASAATLLAAPALSHGPTPQRLEQAVTIDAAPAQVWAALGELPAIAVWHPDVEDAVVTGGRARGAKRSLTFAAGGGVIENIDDIDDAAMSLRWRLSKENVEAFPASFYSHDLKVTAEGAGAAVTWKANFYRADTSNYPSETQDDAAAVAAMEAFVSHGLAGLKALVERIN